MSNEEIVKLNILIPQLTQKYRVPLPEVLGVSAVLNDQTDPKHIVCAIYKPTGRGPFRDKDGREVWEYEYVGID